MNGNVTVVEPQVEILCKPCPTILEASLGRTCIFDPTKYYLSHRIVGDLCLFVARLGRDISSSLLFSNFPIACVFFVISSFEDSLALLVFEAVPVSGNKKMVTWSRSSNNLFLEISRIFFNRFDFFTFGYRIIKAPKCL